MSHSRSSSQPEPARLDPAIPKWARSGMPTVLAFLLVLACWRPAGGSQGCSTEWISKSWNGQPASNDSQSSALSADGRFVAFDSGASNLVPGDGNGKPDVFVVDRQLNTIERVSVSSTGVEGNGGSGTPAISADGRFVVFISASTNLDPLDPDPRHDTYIHDRQAKTTQLVSVHIKPPAGIFPWDGSMFPSISPDGRYVLFTHGEDNIVPGDANGVRDIFLKDMLTGSSELVSLSSSQTQADEHSYAGVMSADARYIAFVSRATNWYPGNTAPPGPKAYAYLRDRVQGTTIPVNPSNSFVLDRCGSSSEDLAFSADGRFLVYSYGWDVCLDPTSVWIASLFVRDMVTGVTQPVDHGIFSNPSPPKPLLLLQSKNPSISADGRFIAFESDADDLVLNSGNTGGINVFVHDRMTGLTHPAGLGPSGQWPSLPPQTGAEAFWPSISADGHVISFRCEDPTFGSGNAWYNIYVRTCDWSQPAVYCASQMNSLGCTPSISSSGSPSASAGSGFTIGVKRLVSSTFGLFFYSTQRPLLAPFQGSYLCMELPIWRMALQPTGGNTAVDCTGGLQVDFNAWIASGADPSLVAGENVCIQAWSRDAGAVTTTNLSNAIVFAIGP
jgi:Tol biopolymer transport system component